MTEESRVQISLTIPVTLREFYEESAKEHKRSLNAELWVALVREQLRRESGN